MNLLDWYIYEGSDYFRFSPLIPFLIGLLRIRKLSRAQIILFVSVIWAGLIEWSSTELYVLLSLPTNAPFFHFHTLGEYLLLVSVFFFIRNYEMSRSLYFILCIGFVLAFILSIIFYQGLLDTNSFTRSVEAVVLVVLSVRAFRQILDRPDIENIGKSFLFWFSAAVFLYYVANLLLFFYSNSIINNSDESVEQKNSFMAIYSMFLLFNFIFYTLLGISLTCKDSNLTQQPKSSWSVT